MGNGTGVLDAPDALTIPGIERKSAPGVDGGVLKVDDNTGVVEALVSVTGVEDEVKDIILPGAYADTLKKRKPKGVFSHDWGRWVARTEAVEEWLPGDPRLPAQTREGKAWPKEAGALYVRMRFNVKTREGLDAYENVKFFSETGECEWSIGYHVPAGKSTRDRAGVRHIKSLELFEYSPVLFGAAPLSGTLAVKSRLAALEPVGDEDVEAAFERMLHEDGMAEVDWDAVEAATELLEGKAAESAREALQAKAQGGLDRNRGNAEQLRRWYVHGGGAALIRWGEDGDFMRCVRIAAKHMPENRAKGYCNLRHQDATGATPGHAATEQHKWLADEVLAEWSPEAEVGEYAGTKSYLTIGDAVAASESKGFPFLSGSFEESQDALRTALNASLRGDPLPREDDKGDGDRPSYDSDRREWSYVEVVGTYDDRVIARRSAYYGPNSGKNETYEVPYTRNADGTVSLGDPEPVVIEVTAEVMSTRGNRDTHDDGDGDEGASPDPQFIVLGALKGIEQTALGVQMASALAEETKAGRVLSSANATALKSAVEHLVAVLRSAGVDIDGDGGGEGAGADEAKDGAQPTEVKEAPVATEVADLTFEDGGEGKVLLDPAVVAARREALRSGVNPA